MNFKEICNEVAKENNLTQKEVYFIGRLLIKSIVKNIITGHKVNIDLLGNFTLKVMKSRKFHNPINKELIFKPKKFKLNFSPSVSLKKSIDEKKAY